MASMNWRHSDRYAAARSQSWRRDLNPILMREIKARWRTWPAVAVTFLYALMLAVLVAGAWATHYHPDFMSFLNAETSPLRLGRPLLATLTQMQIAGWMLLAPILTVSAISGERERGLLQSLLLSALSPREIIAGKWLSALSLLGLLLLLPIPVIALCFAVGGVTSEQVWAAVLLNALTAATCATFGLFCSAWSRRTGPALTFALIALGAYNFFCIAAMPGSMSMAGPSNSNFVLNTLNPIVAAHAVFFDMAPAAGGVDWMNLNSYFVIQLILMWMMLKSAAQALLRVPLERETRQDASAAPPAPVNSAAANSAAWLDRPGLSLAASGAASTAPSGRVALPLAGRLQFSNAVLRREVHLRLRAPFDAAWWSKPGNQFLIAAGYLLAVLVGNRIFRQNWTSFATFWLLALGVQAAVIGGMAFTREREQGMLETLLLTPMKTREIIAGKMGASLIVCAYYSLALLPVILLSLREVPASQVAATCLVAAALVWFCTACGLFFSWICFHTAVAIGGAIVVAPGLWGALFGLLCEYVFDKPWFVAFMNRPSVLALNLWITATPGRAWLIGGAAVSIALCLVGALMLGLVWLAMRNSPRQRDRRTFGERWQTMRRQSAGGP